MDNFDIKSMFESSSVNLPSLRDVLRQQEKAKDRAAYDHQARELESWGGLTAQEDKDRWHRAYRKMKENKAELEKQGSIHYKSKKKNIYVLKFRKDKGDKRVQSAIHLGSSKISALAAMVLHAWREGQPLVAGEQEKRVLREDPMPEKFLSE